MSSRLSSLGPLQALLGAGGGAGGAEPLIASPDTAHMLPYKPKLNPMPGEHPHSRSNHLHYALCFKTIHQ